MVIELKKPGVPARAAFDENLTHYKQQIPALFWFNALLIASNGTDSRVGSLTADWERFFEWKRIEREDEPRRVSLEVMLRGTCDRARLLDLVENFTLFSEHKAGLVKILGQNHQFLGVNNAIASMLEARKLGHGRGGVFWQTQGSGKSFSMVFFAQKVLRKLAGNWTFVVVTDRVELDDQIAKTFKTVGAVSEAEGDECHAASGAHLRELLRGNHRYVFTLIHKFQTPEMLCDRPDVIVLTDEAHRSQYDTLALNMRAALPKAMFLAFTGTPLIAGEERTQGGLRRLRLDLRLPAVGRGRRDGAAVLREPHAGAAARQPGPQRGHLPPDRGGGTRRRAGGEARAGTGPPVPPHHPRRPAGDGGAGHRAALPRARLRGQGDGGVHRQGHRAQDARQGAEALGGGDRAGAEGAGELAYRPRGGEMTPEQAQRDRRMAELKQRLDVLTTTDMALIVSPGQNEIEQMKKLGLDIEPHRRRMNESQPALDEKFKDTDDPLRLVFVCAMWLTGFDAPSCSTVYLDKPMRNHTLMQTIARANRVFPGKHSGVIVDYANVFASLEKALAIYGAGKGGESPVRDKQQLVDGAARRPWTPRRRSAPRTG